MRSLWEKNLKRAFLTVAPFIVKFRFEKYRYLLTHLLCLQIFEVLLSDKHSTGPRNGRLVPLPVACLVWWYSFRPQIYDESETDQILNAKYFVWKNYTLGKWGLREAFNQNSLMQLFNGDRRIVQWDAYVESAKKNRQENGEPSDRLNKSRLKLALSSSVKTVYRTPTRELQDLPQTALS